MLAAVLALERVVEDVVGHLNARRLAIIAGGAEMDAGKDAGGLHFLQRRI